MTRRCDKELAVKMLAMKPTRRASWLDAQASTEGWTTGTCTIQYSTEPMTETARGCPPTRRVTHRCLDLSLAVWAVSQLALAFFLIHSDDPITNVVYATLARWGWRLNPASSHASIHHPMVEFVAESRRLECTITRRGAPGRERFVTGTRDAGRDGTTVGATALLYFRFQFKRNRNS